MEVVGLGTPSGGPAGVGGFGVATGATGLGALGGAATGAAVAGFGALGGGAAGALAAGLAAVGPAPPVEMDTRPSLVPKTPATSSGTNTRFWSERLDNPPVPIVARIRGRGKSIRVSSREASALKVPGGEPRRNCPNGILTAPVRNCSAATLAGSENIPPGRSKTSAAKFSGSDESTSFNGNASVSPVGVAPRSGAAAAAAAAAGAPAVIGFGSAAATGAGTDSGFAGAAAGGGPNGLKKNFFIAPNINRAVVRTHTARTHSPRR